MPNQYSLPLLRLPTTNYLKLQSVIAWWNQQDDQSEFQRHEFAILTVKGTKFCGPNPSQERTWSHSPSFWTPNSLSLYAGLVKFYSEEVIRVARSFQFRLLHSEPATQQVLGLPWLSTRSLLPDTLLLRLRNTDPLNIPAAPGLIFVELRHSIWLVPIQSHQGLVFCLSFSAN